MTGISQYNSEQIRFILHSLVHRRPVKDIQREFQYKYERKLTANQVRYIKNKYGRDPRFDSIMVNFRGVHAADLSRDFLTGGQSTNNTSASNQSISNSLSSNCLNPDNHSTNNLHDTTNDVSQGSVPEQPARLPALPYGEQTALEGDQLPPQLPPQLLPHPPHHLTLQLSPQLDFQQVPEETAHQPIQGFVPYVDASPVAISTDLAGLNNVNAGADLGAEYETSSYQAPYYNFGTLDPFQLAQIPDSRTSSLSSMTPFPIVDPLGPVEPDPVVNDLGATPETPPQPPAYMHECEYGQPCGYGDMHGYGQGDPSACVDPYGYENPHGYGAAAWDSYAYGDPYEHYYYYAGDYEYPLLVPVDMDPGLQTTQFQDPYLLDLGQTAQEVETKNREPLLAL